VSHINLHLYWSLEKFHDVWNEKSHEMISYILVGMVLLSEWEHRSSTKSCNLAQMTLIDSTTKVMKGSCWVNVKKMSQLAWNPSLRVNQVAALTNIKLWLLYQQWSLTINKSCSLVCVLQTLFKDPSLNLHLSLSNRGYKFESTIVFSPRKIF
jgi:hypothetical protein